MHNIDADDRSDKHHKDSDMSEILEWDDDDDDDDDVQKLGE